MFFIVFFFSFAVKAEEEKSSIENYFRALKYMDYDRADSISKNWNNQDEKVILESLVRILRSEGNIYTDSLQFSNSSLLSTGILQKLLNGYSALYHEPYSNLPFLYFTEAYQSSISSGYRELEKFCLLSIIEVYNREFIQTNNDAIEYLKRFEDRVEDTADQFHLFNNQVLFSFRNIFLKTDIDDDFFIQFEQVMQNFPKSHPFWPKYYSVYGVYLETKQKWGDALKIHELAKKELEDDEYSKTLKFRTLIRMAEINRRLGDFHKALEFVEMAGDFRNPLDTTRSDFYLAFYRSLNLYEIGESKRAYQNLRLAMDLKNILDYERNIYEISDLNRKYQTKEKEIALLKEREKVKNQQYIILTVIGVLIFLTMIYYFIQRDTRKKRLLAERENEIQKAKVATLLKEQELSLIDAMIEGQEKERQKLASDLHDDLGSHMASIRLHFSMMEAKMSLDAKEMYNQTSQLIGEAYEKIRAMAHEKNSGVLANEGLLKSVKSLALKNSVAHGLTIKVNSHGLDTRLENSLELNLFRIIQELVTNIIKHSEASEAYIHITNHGDSLNIMVEDNGKGFVTEKLTLKEEGMGIKSIDKRVEALNGTMQIESEIDSGTTVIINIPI